MIRIINVYENLDNIIVYLTVHSSKFSQWTVGTHIDNNYCIQRYDIHSEI